MHAKSPLPPSWNVPQIFRDRLGEQAGRQRAMEADGHLLLVLRQPPTRQLQEREDRIFWRNPDDAWQTTCVAQSVRSLSDQLEDYQRLVDKLESDEDEAQKADEYKSLIEYSGRLARSARHLHAALQEARELLPDVRELIVHRDRAYAVERAAELVHTDLQNGLQWAIARRSEEYAESAERIAKSGHRLNLMVATFLPLATLAGVFGMNVASGLEETRAIAGVSPFILLTAAGIIAGLLLRQVVKQ